VPSPHWPRPDVNSDSGDPTPDGGGGIHGFCAAGLLGGAQSVVPSEDYSHAPPRVTGLRGKKAMNTPKHPVLPVATITVDTNPANLTPFCLTLHTPSGPRSYEFSRITQAVWLAQMVDKRIRCEIEVLPA
jgi:hypothetical protein